MLLGTHSRIIVSIVLDEKSLNLHNKITLREESITCAAHQYVNTLKIIRNATPKRLT